MERGQTKSALVISNVPLRRLGQVELIAAGGAFIAPAFSLAAIFSAIALTGGAVFRSGMGTVSALVTGRGLRASWTSSVPPGGGAMGRAGTAGAARAWAGSASSSLRRAAYKLASQRSRS